MIWGFSTIAVAILGTTFSFGPGSPVEYILWGAGALGVLNTMKGLAEIIGLI